MIPSLLLPFPLLQAVQVKAHEIGEEYAFDLASKYNDFGTNDGHAVTVSTFWSGIVRDPRPLLSA